MQIQTWRYFVFFYSYMYAIGNDCMSETDIEFRVKFGLLYRHAMDQSQERLYGMKRVRTCNYKTEENTILLENNTALCIKKINSHK